MILGRPDFANLDQRLFNVMCFGGTIVAVLSALENAFIHVPFVLVVGSCVQTVILASGFVVSRYWNIYRPVVWPVILAILAFLAMQWFWNAGSVGGAHYFFFVCGMMGAVIMRGWQRYFVILLYLVVINAVLYLEYIRPDLIVNYTDRQSRYVDIAFSLSLCMILFGLVIAIFSGHYQVLVNRVQRHKLEFVEDLHLARILQETVFQHDRTLTQGFDCEIVYRPSAALGGDLYDLSRRLGILRVFMADMKGHGVNAALSSMLIKSEWVHSGHASFSAGDALANLNKQVVARYGDSLVLSAIVADLYEDSIHFAAAGHVPQFRVFGGEVLRLEATGVPIGVMEDSQYSTERTALPRGSRLVFFTDGFHDQPDLSGKTIGTDWMEEILRKSQPSSADMVRALISKFHAKTGTEPGTTADDLTLIVIGR